MAVKLRLVRMGKKKQPTYRVVAADSRSPRDGRFLEVVGTYAPRGSSRADAAAVVTIDHDKALRWLRQGAKPTDRVERLLRSSGTLDRLGAETPAATGGAASASTAPAEGADVSTESAPGAAPAEGADVASTESETSAEAAES